MNQGWVAIYRKLRKNPIYTESKAVHVLLECLLRASYEKTAVYKGQDKIELKPGQFFMGREEFGKSIGMSGSTAWRWIHQLEADNILDIKTSPKGTIVTIKNWDHYQNPDNDPNIKRTSDEHQMNTNNKVNNINNKKLKESIDSLESNKRKSSNKDQNKNQPAEEYNKFAPTTGRGLNYQKIKEKWNSSVPEPLKIKRMTDKRKRKLRTRYKEEDFSLQEIINALSEQPFALGQNERGWAADFSWIIDSEEHYNKILERKYADKAEATSKDERILDSVQRWAEEKNSQSSTEVSESERITSK